VLSVTQVVKLLTSETRMLEIVDEVTQRLPQRLLLRRRLPRSFASVGGGVPN
jgi:hypothetical protein